MTDAGTGVRTSALPALDPFLGTLPPNPFPYRVSLSEIHEVFVEAAPHRERRELVFRALVLYSEVLWEEVPDARLWINGGFATQKAWEAPRDVDIAVVADGVSAATKRRLVEKGLVTMSDVAATVGTTMLPPVSKLAPFGGLVDAYLTSSLTSDVYRRKWATVRGPDGQILTDVTKGFLEVAQNAV